jgi:predicted phage terminase large subunit-like protein
MNLSPVKAAELLLRRRTIRKSLTSWCELAGYEPAPHHKLLISKLEAVTRGEITRLAVFMPPGSAKSTYGSILFAPWFLAQYAQANIIAASHTTELAEKWGRKVRNLMAEHGNTLGVELSGDSQAAGRWSLKQGGEYYAAGVGVGIAGFRADLAIIDDPVRSREDAESETVREKLWEWYQSDLSTRMKPGGRQILVQTRWHELDLAGRLLDAMAAGGEQWEVLSLPAEAQENDPLGRKPGEWLWDSDPAYAYGDFLRHEKKNQTPRNWNALYQQRPAPEEGSYFLRDWIKFVDVLPPIETMRVYAGSDMAVSDGRGDFTVHAICALDSENKLYLLDLWRQQASSDVWVESLCDLILKWRPIGLATETGQINSAMGPYLQRRMRERNAWTFVETFPTRGDKSIRAQSVRGKMALDGLHIPSTAPWRHTLVSELLSFPAGRNDDIVDALGLIGQFLDRMLRGQAPPQPPKRRFITFRHGVPLPGPPEEPTGYRIKI